MTAFTIRTWPGQVLLHDTRPGGPQLEWELVQALDTADQLTLTVHAGHPAWRALGHGQQIVVQEAGTVEPLMVGRVKTVKTGLSGTETVTVMGDLSDLATTVQPEWKVTGSPLDALTRIIAEHNAQASPDRRFTVGTVSDDLDPNNLIVRSVEAVPRPTSLEVLQRATWDSTAGGHVWTRGPAGARIIDWVSPSGLPAGQPIRFGDNLIDLARTLSAVEWCTAVEPFGAQIEDPDDPDATAGETRPRLQLGPADGATLLWTDASGTPHYGASDPDLVAQVGLYVTTQAWDDVHTPSVLKQRAFDALAKGKLLTLDLDAQTIDRHLLDVDVQAFRKGQQVRVVVPGLGIDDTLTVQQVTMTGDPSAWQVQLSNSRAQTLADQINSLLPLAGRVEEVVKANYVLGQAVTDTTVVVGLAQDAAATALAAAGTAQTAASAASTAAAEAAGIASGKGKVIYATTAPTATADRSANNLWIDISGTPAKNQPYRWSGAAWVAVTDKAATDAAASAATAQTA
ncbi:MAG: phage tail protein, partial [Propionibacteriaceae bacterium]|nr:phage tail protein [Propionibacteriaceae bacterium]